MKLLLLLLFAVSAFAQASTTAVVIRVVADTDPTFAQLTPKPAFDGTAFVLIQSPNSSAPLPVFISVTIPSAVPVGTQGITALTSSGMVTIPAGPKWFVYQIPGGHESCPQPGVRDSLVTGSV